MSARSRPALRARMLEIRDEWIAVGLCTEPADRPAAERALAQLYEHSGRPAPRLVLWVRSPFEGIVAAAVAQALRGTRDAPRWTAWAYGGMFRARDSGPVARRVAARLHEAAREDPQHLLEDASDPEDGFELELAELECRDPGHADWIEVRVEDAVRTQTAEAAVAAAVGLPTLVELPSPCLPTLHGVSALAADAARELVTGSRKGRAAALRSLARTAGWCWELHGVAIVSDRPWRLRVDADGRLHDETGPAVAWRDGTAVWAVRGVRVPRDVVEDPGSLTVERIALERNTEVSAVMIDRYGRSRYLRDAGGELLHADGCGRLWRLDGAWGEPIVVVEVQDPAAAEDGPRSTYLLRVDPACRTAHEAVAWTFGLPKDAYRPTAES